MGRDASQRKQPVAPRPTGGKASANAQLSPPPFSVLVLLVSLQHSLDFNLFTPEGFQATADRAGIWGPELCIALLAVSVVVS